MVKKTEWSKLGKDKLNSSGLTSTQGTALGMYEVASAAQLDKSFEARPAIVIPYFGPDRKPLSPHPKWPVFYRVRYLGERPKGFEDLAGGKPQRYSQPPESGVCAYFPLSTDWNVIAKDPEYEIIITEGELKAAAASAEGFPTIGLGGVWCFRSSKDGTWFLPELERVAWNKRTTYVCFDNDYLSKPNICMAINALLGELQERGAYVRVVSLPVSEEKIGLDDYLVAKGADGLRELLAQAEPLGLTKVLWQMNEEVVYVEDPGLVLDVREPKRIQKMDAGKFRNESQWSTNFASEIKLATSTGKPIYDKVPAAPVWIRWPLRRTAKRMTYAPGQPQFTDDKEMNLWPGWGSEPAKGDVKPWLKLTQYLFADAEPDVLEYFYDWCAYPIQHPGTKMFVAVVIHGTAQGTGKTLVGYTLRRIYGENFKEIGDDDLEESYWAENKQFILGDEITGKDNRQHMNMLKRLITKDTIDINIKFVPQYTLPNCMNFMFTSQHSDSFFLEDKDRRFMVVEVESEPLPQSFYKEYDTWYKGAGGAHLMQWLLDRKINPKFDPSAPAPRTMAKERMIVATKGDAASWVHELKLYPDQVLMLGQMTFTRDLFSSAELLKIYEGAHANSKLTAVGLGRQLSGAGLTQVSDGSPLMNPNTGKMERLFAVRNLDYWRKHGKDKKRIDKNLMLSPKRSKK